MTDLSPEAQAVLNAIKADLDLPTWDVLHRVTDIAAFALRAAADQVVPVAECRKDPSDSCCERSIKQERSDIRILLRDIAFELEEVKS